LRMVSPDFSKQVTEPLIREKTRQIVLDDKHPESSTDPRVYLKPYPDVRHLVLNNQRFGMDVALIFWIKAVASKLRSLFVIIKNTGWRTELSWNSYVHSMPDVVSDYPGGGWIRRGDRYFYQPPPVVFQTKQAGQTEETVDLTYRPRAEVFQRDYEAFHAFK